MPALLSDHFTLVTIIMSYLQANIFAFSIFLAGIVSFYRFNKVNVVYQPFIYFIWLGCLAELFSLLVTSNRSHNTLVYNLYVLLEGLLLVYFFKNIGVLKDRGLLFYLVIISICIAWVVEWYINGKMNIRFNHFRVFYSFIIVFLSIGSINKILLNSNLRMNADPVFLISISFIIYFTYKILLEAFAYYGVGKSISFQKGIYDIMSYINLGVNLVYATTLLWMPKKIKFTLPY